MDYISFGMLYMVAIMSPGPSLVVILKNSMNYSSKNGFFTAIGTVSGIFLQSALTLLFFNIALKEGYLLSFIGVILSIYLFYIGFKHLFAFFKDERDCGNIQPDTGKGKTNCFLFRSWRQGFLVDVFNPLALVFFFSIFSVYIKPDNSFLVNFLYWVEVILIGSIWYLSFSLLISTKFVQEIIFVKLRTFLNFAVSCMLLFLAIKIFIDSLSKLLSSGYFV